ncbi:hypothetical protein DFQ27_006198 [Actinomortierella ambigua]|uniref:Late embryogenesis abundant protein LEA-2 subgroup domain-containing protein n=1 Tax=Actinomortierella ambigua TaxID=1343610 RepID=A0A9P6U0T1_9FUNG|nr:hypothetical protein DFQ27_006198 [Actinomortierella ambigua]
MSSPAYHNHNNANYIDSPFDEPYEKQPSYYGASTPYNPAYQQSPSLQHATYDQHSLDAEKHSNNSSYQQAYAMHDIGQNNSNGYGHDNNSGKYYSSRESYQQAQATPQLYNGYDEDRPSISNDTEPMRPRDAERGSSPDGSITPIKYRKEKSKYLPCFPCIRSTCGRVMCCICLLLLLIIIALAIVIVTVFKLPQVDFVGMSQQPQFTFNQGNTFAASMTAAIRVQNPNPIGFTFDKITAKAYYPGYAPQIGGGEVSNARFPSKATTDLNFPLNATYSATQDPGYTVVSDIANRCGLTGGQLQKLQINYDLTLTLNIVGINISPTIKNQHVSFDCPSNIAQILDEIPQSVRQQFGF